MKALHGSEPGRRRSAAGLHASLDSVYRTARSARQVHIRVRIRVARVPAGAAATTLPALRIRHHHRPRPTAQAGPRRTPRLDLGTARSLPPVWRNLHHPSCLVAAVRTLQFGLPARGLGIELPSWRRLGTDCPAVQRSQSITRSSHVAALGLSQIAESMLQREGLLVLLAWLADFLARAHHPCLGLGCGRA